MPQRTLGWATLTIATAQTARLLADHGPGNRVAFQRVRRAKSLAATDVTLENYPAQGVTKIAIAAPGFSADCLETIEELGIRGRADFLAAGGTHFARLDCLNDSEPGMAMLETLLRRELAGWWS